MMSMFASQEKSFELLGVSEQLFERLRTMRSQGVAPAAMVSIMQAEGVTKPGAEVALCQARVLSLMDARELVHESPAYAYRREADEAFEESVVQAFAEIERTEAA